MAAGLWSGGGVGATNGVGILRESVPRWWVGEIVSCATSGVMSVCGIWLVSGVWCGVWSGVFAVPTQRAPLFRRIFMYVCRSMGDSYNCMIWSSVGV